MIRSLTCSQSLPLSHPICQQIDIGDLITHQTHDHVSSPSLDLTPSSNNRYSPKRASFIRNIRSLPKAHLLYEVRYSINQYSSGPWWISGSFVANHPFEQLCVGAENRKVVPSTLSCCRSEHLEIVVVPSTLPLHNKSFALVKNTSY